jgi:hypothetical protein
MLRAKRLEGASEGAHGGRRRCGTVRQYYFLKVIDAQITFKNDGHGQATELILHQNSMNTPGKRME